MSEELNRPDWAKPAPEFEVGDILFRFELDDGLSRHVVVFKDDDGCIMTVCLGSEPDENQKLYGIWHGFFSVHKTPDEAYRSAAEWEISYHGRRLKRAKEFLLAIENSQPFEHIIGELEGDEDY